MQLGTPTEPNSPDAHVHHVHQSSGFLNRVHWFDSGRGHSREAVSEAALRVWAAPHVPFELISLYQPSTTSESTSDPKASSTMMLKTHLLWHALCCPVVSTL
jgi:hypothetical protein